MTRPTRHDSGQDIIEFALVLPLLMLFALGIVEFGIAVLAYNSVANAAREGARVGVSLSPGDEHIITDAVIQRMAALSLTSDDITVDWPESDTGDLLIEITVAYDHRWITGPIIRTTGGGLHIPLRSVATMRRERS